MCFVKRTEIKETNPNKAPKTIMSFKKQQKKYKRRKTREQIKRLPNHRLVGLNHKLGKSQLRNKMLKNRGATKVKWMM
jgi:hypothetical protein